MADSPATNWINLPLTGVIAGYFAACLAAVVSMTIFFAFEHLRGFVAYPVKFLWAMVSEVGISFLFAIFVACPGFMALRHLLHLLRLKDRVSFILADGANAYFSLTVFNTSESTVMNLVDNLRGLIFLVFGGLAGLTSWMVERWFAQRAAIRISEESKP